jgi:hypothetical protein
MWIIEDAVNNITNKVVVPADGIITISKPDTASVDAFVNDSPNSTQQVEVKAGDTVYFKLTNWKKGQTPIGFTYGDNKSIIMLPGKTAEVNTATTSSIIERGNNMAEILQPSGMMMSGAGDGGLGFGSGGGLIGGLILGSLLRQGNGGLFGNNGDAGTAVTAQGTANMQLMQSIGAVDKAVAVGTAQMEASQATQTIGITSQLNNTTASLANRIDGVKDVMNTNNVAIMQQLNGINTMVMATANETQKAVYNDGDKTRALIVNQYELNLQRQLADANNQIIELRGDNRLQAATNGINVTTTNNINQMQQQMQQQSQYDRLGGYIASLAQSIRSTNEAINVGSGTLTANPANTNTNIR